jgi:hypothetical protein
MGVPILTRRELNRALLARQHLLERVVRSAPAMVDHLVGMQAQVPANPYVALWSRVEGFGPDDLAGLIEGRRAVRMSLMRTTLHLVTAGDAYALRPVMQGVLERGFASGSPFHRDLVGLDTGEVIAAGRDLLDGALAAGTALTTNALGKGLGERWPDRNPVSLSYAVRYLVPMVQVPPRGLWGRSGQARWATLDGWLGRPLDGAADPDEVVIRYLAAFGPASVKDVATWSWLTGVREIVDRLRPRLRTFRDERGTELFDVPDGPLPDPDTPAPPRLLPEYDNIALSHDDRSRIIAPTALGRLTGYVGTLLLDGFVDGQWRLDTAKDAATLVLDPFRPLAALERDALVAEGERLLAFAAPDAAARRIEFGVAREVAPNATDPARGQWAPR